MARGVGEKQQAILRRLRGGPPLDAEGLARHVYGVWEKKPTRSQVNTVRLAIEGLLRRGLVKTSPYRGERDRTHWVAAVPRGQIQFAKRQKALPSKLTLVKFEDTP